MFHLFSTKILNFAMQHLIVVATKFLQFFYGYVYTSAAVGCSERHSALIEVTMCFAANHPVTLDVNPELWLRLANQQREYNTKMRHFLSYCFLMEAEHFPTLSAPETFSTDHRTN